MNISKNTDVVIKVDNVTKKFKSYHDKATSFKERVVNPTRSKHEDTMVLKGVSFQVNRGEAIGIIGKNGCGKSTTLKLLTRILYPNSGSIEMKGRVSSLIELGAGFHPDMTGRENIYTNASIFGIKRKEVDERMNDIIRFSELEDFIDNPVRTYSSGMYMRLAFAVAINVNADILLIDEILAVGDSAFQKKCFEKLKEIKANGTTIVIVSHSMEQMYKICDRLIWIEKGLIKDEGAPRIIGEAYLAEMEGRRLERIDHEKQEKIEEINHIIQEEQKRLEQEELDKLQQKKRELEINEKLKDVCKFCYPSARRTTVGKIQYTSVKLLDYNGDEVTSLVTGKEYTLELGYHAEELFPDVRFSLGFTRDDGIYCYGTSHIVKNLISSDGEIKFSFVNALLEGKYTLDLWIEKIDSTPYDSVYNIMMLDITTEPYIERGILTMKHSWSVEE